MKFDKIDLLFMAGVVDVVAMSLCGICLVMSILGNHLAKDMFWYGMGTMVTGVIFKLILDKLRPS